MVQGPILSDRMSAGALKNERLINKDKQRGNIGKFGYDQNVQQRADIDTTDQSLKAPIGYDVPSRFKLTSEGKSNHY